MYWARLPGAAAFCGLSAGISAAKICLSARPEYVCNTAFYINLLLFTAIIFAALGILCKRAGLRLLLLSACGAALFTWSELGIRGFYGRMEAICDGNRIQTLRVRIASPVASTRSGNKFRGTVLGADDGEAERELAGKTLQITSRKPMPPYGAITIQGRYAAPRRAAGPFGFDQRAHFAANNIRGSFAVSRILDDGAAAGHLSTAAVSYTIRTSVHGVINKASTQEARGIFHAAFLGEREHIPESMYALFRKSGVVHLLTISGFHAALLYSAVFAFFNLFPIPARAKTLVSLGVLWGYLFFIGFIPPLFRATVMVTFFCASMMLQRKNHAVHSLGIAGFLWLCLSPHSLFAPGFQLSFAATAGIVMLQPALNGITYAVNSRLRSKPAEFLMGKLLSPLWLSIATFAATAPPLLYHFGALSVYGIPFNLIAIPMMSAAMWLFFAAVILSPVGFAANALIWCAEKVLGWMITLGGYCEGISISEIAIPHTPALSLLIMAVFMAGQCAIRANLRGAYALRAGAAAAFAIAASTAYASINAKAEKVEIKAENSTVNVVIHKDNTAWITAQGRRNEVRNLRVREVEPLLARKKVKGAALILVDENLEDEAHEFAFNTGFNPRIVILREAGNRGERRGNNVNADFIGDGYKQINAQGFVNPDKTCDIAINAEAKENQITININQ
jgi:ComEC/Rec2-related protein